MAIYFEPRGALGHMFNARTTDQINEFIPEKRGSRIHGHSTTIRLETAFWSVLEEKARKERLSLPEVVEMIHDQCIVANEKNPASCLDMPEVRQYLLIIRRASAVFAKGASSAHLSTHKPVICPIVP